MMRFADSDMARLDALLREAGEAEILPRFGRLDASHIEEKESAHDLVTIADRNAEHLITAALERRYPGALIIGEEAAAERPRLIDGLEDADLAFVIDPVDGTYNFASAMPVFGCMLGAIVNGECVAGLIHYPVGGETLMAVAGSGSRLVDATGRETTVRVAEPVDLEEMVGTISWGFMKEPRRSRVAANLSKIGMNFALRCSAWEYRMAAIGKVHFIGGQKLMPWDHLPGVLIHAEAGGYSALLNGERYRPGITDGGLISATDPESWALIRREVIGAPFD